MSFRYKSIGGELFPVSKTTRQFPSTDIRCIINKAQNIYEYWLKGRNDGCKTLECFDSKFSIMLLFTIICMSCPLAAYASFIIKLNLFKV